MVNDEVESSSGSELVRVPCISREGAPGRLLGCRSMYWEGARGGQDRGRRWGQEEQR